MQYADFEKHANKTFAFDVEYVDTEQLLANLSLGQKPKRKLPLLWIFGALIGLGLLGSLAYGWPNTSNSVENGLATVLAEEQEDNPTVNTNKTLPVEAATTKDEANPKTAFSTTPIDKEVETSSYTEAISNTTLTKNEISDNSPASSIPSKNEETSSPISDLSSSNESAKSASLSIDVEESAALPILEERNALSIRHLDILTPDLLEDIERDLPLGDPIQCPSFKEGRGLHFDLIPELGYMIPDKSLTDESTESSLITSIRRDEERSLEGLQAALYGRITMDNFPLYLKAGLAYTRISERLALEYDYIELDTTIGIISISSNPAGDTITTVMGPIVTETQFTGNTTKHYYLHQWDFPIALGYERPLGGFMLGIEGGLHFNLRTSVTGNILDTQDTFREAERGVDVKRRVGLNYFGGVHLGKYIPGFGDVYLAARARFIPDVSDDATQTKQNYMLYGLHAGYVYRF